jgi:Fe-S oxidoreductase
MPTYISLLRYTDQGARNIKDAPKRLDEAKTTGAEAIATACSSCNRILGSAQGSDGTTMKAIDVLELVEQAL